MGLFCSLLNEPITDKHSEDATNDTLAYGSSSMQGWRDDQEDAHNSILDFGNDSAFFAVYDGHGGFVISEYCAKALPDYIKQTEEYKNGDYKQALITAFLGFDDSLLTEDVKAELKNCYIEGKKRRKEEKLRRKEIRNAQKKQKLAENGDKESRSYAESSRDESAFDESREISNLYKEADMPIEEVIDKVYNEKSPKRRTAIVQSSITDGCSSSGSPRRILRSPSSKIEKKLDEEVVKKDESSKPELNKDKDVTSKSDDLAPITNGDINLKSADKIEDGSGDKEVDSEKKAVDNDEDGNVDKQVDGEKNQEVNQDAQKISRRKLKKMLNEDLWKMFKNKLTQYRNKELDDAEEDSEDSDDSDTPFDPEVCNEDDGEDENDEGENDDEEETQEEDDDENEAADESTSEADSDDMKDEDELEALDDSSDDDCGDDGDYNTKFGITSGSTACVALLTPNMIYVANAGDSRCIASKGGEVIELSHDHKPEDEPERSRIKKAGGYIHDGRVDGGLNLSRAIGDHTYKKGSGSNTEQKIVALPDILTCEITPDLEFLVLACDGIWNSMSNEQVVDFVRPKINEDRPLSKICEELFQACLAPNILGDGTGCDNMTCVIVKFLKTPFSSSNKSMDENIGCQQSTDKKSGPKITNDIKSPIKPDTNISVSAASPVKSDTNISVAAASPVKPDTNISESATCDNKPDTNISASAASPVKPDANISVSAASPVKPDANISESATCDNSNGKRCLSPNSASFENAKKQKTADESLV